MYSKEEPDFDLQLEAHTTEAGFFGSPTYQTIYETYGALWDLSINKDWLQARDVWISDLSYYVDGQKEDSYPYFDCLF